MSKSQIEELIGCLWLIAALIAFGNDYRIWGGCFAGKAALDMVCSLCRAIQAKSKKD